MSVRTLILLLACLPMMAGCRQNDTPAQPTIDSNPELVAACQHIEGGGAGVTGGDGGAVYRVSRLDDATDPGTGLPLAGTLRYAVNQTGARRVIFTVAGTIHLNSELRVKTGSLTIDGQSAPGDGICIADYPLVINGASNVIVRFIRVRLGDVSNTEYDAVSVNNANGVVLDHLSCSWSVDECVSCYGNTDFTMQYCIVSESLKESVHGKGNHGYGGIWGGTNATFHHNLLAHHDSRNPRFDHDYVNSVSAGPIDYVNNVVYNWGGNSAYGGEGSTNTAGGRHINFVANYYKPGPSTRSSVRERLLNPTTRCSNCTDKCGGSVQPGKFYLTSNWFLQFLHQLDAKDPFKGKNICIEITEQATLAFDDATREAFNTIRGMGLLLAIDDFSMGQTSLHYLKDNMFDIIKLDGSLVQGLFVHQNCREIISSIAQLAASLDLSVIAEYVETAEQRSVLHEIGCDIYQGYLYSPAVFLSENK